MTDVDTRVPRPANPVPQRSAPPLRAAPGASGGWVRVGPVALGSARRYLVTWAVVLFGVLVLLQLGAYVLLSLLGVTGSVSRALAVVSGEPLPASGVVPVLQLHNALPLAVVAALVLSALWLLTAAAAVMMHNAVVELTGGFQVRIRPEARGAAPSR